MSATRSYNIFLRHLFINVCSSLFVTLCSAPTKKRLDITSKHSQLCSNRYLSCLLHLKKLNKSCTCLLNLYFYTFSVPPFLVTTLPKYKNLFTSSVQFSFILNLLSLFALILSDLVSSELINNLPILLLQCKSLTLFSMLTRLWNRRHT